MLEAEARPQADPIPTARIVAGGSAALATFVWLARYGIEVEAVVAAAFFATLALIAAVDFETRRIPNAIVLPAAGLTFATVALLHSERLGMAAVAAGGGFLFFFVPSLISPRLVGMGDAKFALLIGAMLGDDFLSALVLAAFSAGFFAACYVAVSGRRALRATIPFGPFLAVGGGIALIAGGGTLYS